MGDRSKFEKRNILLKLSGPLNPRKIQLPYLDQNKIFKKTQYKTRSLEVKKLLQRHNRNQTYEEQENSPYFTGNDRSSFSKLLQLRANDKKIHNDNQSMSLIYSKITKASEEYDTTHTDNLPKIQKKGRSEYYQSKNIKNSILDLRKKDKFFKNDESSISIKTKKRIITEASYNFGAIKSRSNSRGINFIESD